MWNDEDGHPRTGVRRICIRQARGKRPVSITLMNVSIAVNLSIRSVRPRTVARKIDLEFGTTLSGDFGAGVWGHTQLERVPS